MSAILFGSISTVADTSELQRSAFNEAFRQHGLDWRWDQDQYRDMLSTSGGQSRIAEYARRLGQSVDARAVHRSKSTLFQQNLASAQLAPRDGVVETIKQARSNGWRVGLVTTTSPENISALLDALSPQVRSDDFDVIVDSTSVDRPKPDGAAYAFAVTRLGESPGDCVAIEDNVDGLTAAAAAGVPCVAFPNANTAQHDFAAATERVDHLDPDTLGQLAAPAEQK